MLFTEYELWPPEEMDMYGISEVPEQVYNSALACGKKHLRRVPETLTAAMYIDANHENYDKAYRARRTALASLAAAEYLERGGRFTEDIINGIWSICEESTWELPDGTGRLRDTSSARAELNSACTGALLAQTVHLFRKELPHAVKKRTAYEIRRRVTRPFAETKQRVSPEVCAQSLIACIFTEENEEMRKAAVDRALELLDTFLDEYASGNLKAENEQSLYNNAAFVFDILEMLYNATDRKFEIYSDERARACADFIYKVHLGSDGFSEKATEEDGARIYLFGKRMDSKALMDFGASEFISIEDKSLPDSCNMFHKLYSIKFASEIIRYGDNFDGQECGYVDAMDIFVKKTKGFSVAVKGGASAAGNFMAYMDSEPYVVDLEKSHNLPIVNGFAQFTNTKGAKTEKLENGLALDLSATYPKEAGVISWLRSVEAEEKYIIITDDYEVSKPSDLRIILLMRNKPILSGDRILVGDGSIVWDGEMALRVELVKSKAYDYVYRLVFHIKSDDLKGRVRIALKK